ncbi:MAG TPA: SMC family ATPase [Nitrososphaeraceae archaeon]
MIKAVELENFISHKMTRIAFDRGITIFIGNNGSGKSSVIDAITFALYGQHTRKANKNLVRRGSDSASVNVRLSVGSKVYDAHRRLGSNGQSLYARFDEVLDSENNVSSTIVSGERKQFGDSMSGEVAKILGIDYKKLRIAAIVQQGELSSIIDSQPREFKELLNSLIGIDRLDNAYLTMNEVISAFRERLRADNEGLDDKQIGSIKTAINGQMIALRDAEGQFLSLGDRKDSLKEELLLTEKEIQRMEPLILQSRELQATEDSVINYINGRRGSLAQEIVKLEGHLDEARNALKLISDKESVDINLQMIGSELEDLELSIEHNENESGRLKGILECAKRIEFKKDGRCPVCGSQVHVEIQKIFDNCNIESEIRKKNDEREEMSIEKAGLKKEKEMMDEKKKKIESAEKFLISASIEGFRSVRGLEVELQHKRNDLDNVTAIVDRANDPRRLEIDEFSSSLVKKIIKLREQIEGLNIQEYTDSKLRRSRLSTELLEVNAKLGAAGAVISGCLNRINASNKILLELESASELLTNLENIRSQVFNRDGPVASSLRIWALRILSLKASEYLSMFRTGISRIELAEKAREVQIVCYGSFGGIDMNSLSGGEKVAVALALRLAIAQMMSSNKLDFIVLDEPTTHLDVEKRKSLVRIISDSFKEGGGPVSQIIVITHDSEIFEDSEVEGVYRFTMSTNGTVVASE